MRVVQGALPRYVLQCHVQSLLRPSKALLRRQHQLRSYSIALHRAVDSSGGAAPKVLCTSYLPWLQGYSRVTTITGPSGAVPGGRLRIPYFLDCGSRRIAAEAGLVVVTRKVSY